MSTRGSLPAFSTERGTMSAEPSAYLLTGGRVYQDEVVKKKETADRRCAERNDGSHWEPLYTLEAASEILGE